MDNSIEYLEEKPLYVSSALSLFLCGWEKCAPNHFFGPAIRPHYLFHYILSGEGKFYSQGKCYSLKEKQGFLICPGESTYYVADEKNPWNYCWFGFDGYEAKTILEKCSLSLANPIFLDKSGENLENEMLKLINMFEKAKFNEFEAMGQLYLIFSKMYSATRPQYKSYDENYFNKAIEFINHNYSYDIKISDIAKHIGIDRTYLYKIFMQQHNLSPQQYLIKFRLHIACKLLENSTISITEVALSSGFKDVQAFYKRFKKEYKITPARYRTKYLKE